MLYDYTTFDPVTTTKSIRRAVRANQQALALLLDRLAAASTVSWDDIMPQLHRMEQNLQSFNILCHMHSVADSAAIRDAYATCVPIVERYNTRRSQDQALFQQIQRIDNAQLTSAQARQVALLLQSFRLAGVALPQKQRNQFRRLTTKISNLGIQFANNLVDATNTWHHQVDDDALAGVPEDAKMLFACQNTEKGNNTNDDQQTAPYKLHIRQDGYSLIIKYAQRRDIRALIHKAYATRASDLFTTAPQHTNSNIILAIAIHRQQQARLLGFDTYAELSLATKMADSVDQVHDFLTNMAHAIRPTAEKERETLIAFARDQFQIKKLQPWDYAFVSEQLRQSRYSLDEEATRAYFPLRQVLQGLFAIATNLFAVHFTAVRKNSWTKSITIYKITAAQNQTIGYLYIDVFARDNKRGGAWMNDVQSRACIEDTVQLPIAYLVCNFPPHDNPLLYHHEVETLLHEFGHCLHHLLTKIDILDISGINGVEWDAVELPSQLLENWCRSPQTLPLLSAHHITQQPLPADMLQALTRARNFQSALNLTRQIEFALFDLRLHSQTHFKRQTVDAIQTDIHRKISVLPHAPYERMPESFTHIFSGGYAAGYYSYLWAEVLASNVLALFGDDMLSRQVGEHYHRCFLGQGASTTALVMFEKLCGHKPDQQQFLATRGITTAALLTQKT